SLVGRGAAPVKKPGRRRPLRRGRAPRHRADGQPMKGFLIKRRDAAMTKRTFAAYSVMLVLAAGAASCESDAPKETAALTSQRSNGESRGDPKVESDQEDAVM